MDMIIGIGCILAAMFGTLIAFFCMLCFIQWVSDVIEQKRWRYWIK